MSHRNAATLVEVLVAIFITALGLLSLLALFPLGALTMAQAIKDSRAAHAVQNAAAVCELLDICSDRAVQREMDFPPPSLGPVTVNGLTVLPADPQGDSYPVYADPAGARSFSATPQTAPRVGSKRNLSIGVARLDASTLSALYYPPNPPVNPGLSAQYQSRQTMHWFTLGDDVTFNLDGLPTMTPAGAVQREGKFSWSFMFKRRVGGGARKQVVVYNQRSLQLNTGTLQPQGENAYMAFFFPFNPDGTARNVVWVAWRPGEDPPPIRRGTWILDSTMEHIVAPPTVPWQPPLYGTMHDYFYRVVNTSPANLADLSLRGAIIPPGMNVLELELEKNLQGFVVQPGYNPENAQPVNSANYPGPGSKPPGVIVVMENVIEVFDRGPD